MSAEYFDLHDAAQLLGLSYEDALKLVRSGELPGRKLGGGPWVIEKSAVMAHLEKGTANGD